MKEAFVYDRTLRELLQGIPKTLIKLIAGKEAKKLLETRFPSVEEKEADLVIELEDGEILHIEVQSSDDKEMPQRMLYYALAIQKVHGRFPKQLVLYLGEDDIDIKNSITINETTFTYKVINIKDIDCSLLINSENINDNVLALLCDISDVDKLFNRIRGKLLDLETKRRENYIKKMLYLLRLRPKLHNKLKERTKEEFKMPIVIDKQKDPLYKEGLQDGVEEGLEKGKYQEKIAIAKSMILNNIDLETIVNVTGLTKEEVEKLKRD